MPSATRITVALSEEFIERVKKVSEDNDISIARLVSCLLNQPDEEIARIVSEHRDKLFTSKAAQKEKVRQAKKLLENLDSSEIDRILALASEKQNGN